MFKHQNREIKCHETEEMRYFLQAMQAKNWYDSRN